MKTRAIKFAVWTALNSLRREVRALLRMRRDARAATIVTRAGRQAKMEPLTVKSTLIDAVYFSQEDGRLRVCLSNGEERQFEGVAESDVIAMVTSQSPGQYYIQNVRSRFRRIAA
ncbi:KTSC domain-containing protein [Rhizobium sp. S152]|uniref:KTSC domain-containing protein n=1 Tax=Rhizobium sp. S152 TaxID=3055038 RepID=UPI0025A9EBD8|nr:KTSC domain-containing protein [Rhizobium sp. S152]MDM9626643.1 KTSC domain-containing protein [Rhizobium sp. S152]